ncbi:unnamed protein product [Zymoseptoria tritici ST99CH_1A5]|nr:unnamed protein product [Zymoseptoria tritici ST99CH_1E4]SMR44266.1 unnamed protein product [Zymoseptoria tritici ST99CH_3D1]SMY19420.1 unnamed protein product [Zymoseptoria tritici ST99CH_1A5]
MECGEESAEVRVRRRSTWSCERHLKIRTDPRPNASLFDFINFTTVYNHQPTQLEKTPTRIHSSKLALQDHAMAYFRITLLRSAIGLPEKTSGVLRALGLRKRLTTVYQPVTPSIAGQVFAVKELVDVQEVDRALTDQEMKELRRPDPGFYVESRAKDLRKEL